MAPQARSYREHPHSPPEPLDAEPHALGEEAGLLERRQRARGVPHEVVALGHERADEDELAPLELRDREAALDRDHVGERLLLLGHQAAPARFILRAMCSSSASTSARRSSS